MQILAEGCTLCFKDISDTATTSKLFWKAASGLAVSLFTPVNKVCLQKKIVLLADSGCSLALAEFGQSSPTREK